MKGGERLFSLAELAKKVVVPLAVSVYAEGGDVFSYGVHVVAAEVDRETGRVSVPKYLALDDAGRTINPLFTEAQICGGVMQAVGEVLYEEVIYDSTGQLLIGGIGDAGVPAATEGVEVESVLFEYPSRYPHGARGVGEAGSIGGLPAIVSAAENALGIRLRSTGLKSEYVHGLLRARV